MRAASALPKSCLRHAPRQHAPRADDIDTQQQAELPNPQKAARPGQQLRRHNSWPGHQANSILRVAVPQRKASEQEAEGTVLLGRAEAEATEDVAARDAWYFGKHAGRLARHLESDIESLVADTTPTNELAGGPAPMHVEEQVSHMHLHDRASAGRRSAITVSAAAAAAAAEAEAATEAAAVAYETATMATEAAAVAYETATMATKAEAAVTARMVVPWADRFPTPRSPRHRDRPVPFLFPGCQLFGGV